MRRAIPGAMLLALAASLLGAQLPAPRTQEELRASRLAHRGDFDYLLGDWRFTAESEEWGKSQGRWSAVRLATGDGAHILDEYRIIGEDGETYFASSTLRTYNAHQDRWELVSVSDGDGVQDVGVARKVGDEMHIEQTFGVAGGAPELWRIRYYDIRPDRFSWAADRSLDGGKTWVRNHLRIEARRIGPPRELPSLVSPPAASTPREELAAARRRVMDANFRNDRDSLRAVIGDLERLSRYDALAASASYHEGFAQWLLAASLTVAGDTVGTIRALTGGHRALQRALALHSEDPDVHAMLAWTVSAMALSEPSRRAQLLPELALHRRRALELGPRNPRVVMMDAGMIFYSPPDVGGGQARGLERWGEALELFASERKDDPLAPDWGGALAYGWLANLYLATNPPMIDEARRVAAHALELRPDFWWLRTQVLPRISRDSATVRWTERASPPRR